MAFLVNYGSDRPIPQQIAGGWKLPLGITSSVDDEGLETFLAYELISLTLFPHDIDAAIAEAELPTDLDITADRHAAICHGIRLQRAAEYPPATDYLDGVAKGDQEQVDKYIADCLVVKAKCPFPEL
jgi:hypothetical protein